MFHMFNFHFKIVVVALLALSIFVGSRSFAAETNMKENVNQKTVSTRVGL